MDKKLKESYDNSMRKHPHKLSNSPQIPAYQSSHSLCSLGLLVDVETCNMGENLGLATIYISRGPFIVNAGTPITNTGLNTAYPLQIWSVHHDRKEGLLVCLGDTFSKYEDKLAYAMASELVLYGHV